MNDLEKYEKVNQTESLKELAAVIRSLADSDGRIEGTTQTFDAKKMSYVCENYSLSVHNQLTRKHGIRQQAMMLLMYERNII